MKKKFMTRIFHSVLMILFFSLIVLVGSGAMPLTAWARGSGISGYSGSGGPTQICTKCHGGGTLPTVALTGPTSLAPGGSGVYTLTITGGPAAVGGLDVSTSAGSLQATDSKTKLLNSEVVQNAATAFSGNTLVFTFTLTAPSTTGPLTLYAAGLSANDNGSTSGDNAAGTTLIVNVTAQSAPQISVTDSVAPVNDHQISFGTVLDGSTSDQTVTVSNNGNADLVIGTVASSEPLAPPFSISADNCSGKTIAPAGSCTVTVRFAPTASGPFNDSFDIPSNDPSTPSVTVNVNGTGSTAPAPQISVTDSVAPTNDHQISFGTVLDGSTSDQTVTVSNSGNADLVIGTVASSDLLAPPFSISADNCSGKTIAPAGSCTVTVRFAPTASGPFNDSFDIPSNDSSTPSVTVNMNGTGSTASAPQISVTDSVAPTNDHQISFGTVLDGSTSDQTVTVNNSGNADLLIGTMASLAAPFSISADNCSGKTIAPAGSCTVTVQFAPTASGPFSKSFDIPSNDPSAPLVTVSLSGTGNNPPTAPSLVSPADGQNSVGTEATLQWKGSTDPDEDSITYHLYYCTDSTFVSCAPVNIASHRTGMFFAGSGLMFIGFVMMRGGRARKYMLVLMIAMLMMTGVIVVSCGSGNDSNTIPPMNTDMTQQVSGLNSATTYYWKVIADDGKGGLTSSETWSFSTK